MNIYKVGKYRPKEIEEIIYNAVKDEQKIILDFTGIEFMMGWARKEMFEKVVLDFGQIEFGKYIKFTNLDAHLKEYITITIALSDFRRRIRF